MPKVTSESFNFAASETLTQVVSSNTNTLPQPPFPHLLRSNTPPTESEISLIRNVITTAEQEESRLKELEMASSHTRLTSKTMRKLTDRARQFIIEHNAILSSIRLIPPEILQNIFIHTLPSPSAVPGSRISLISQLPWALSQVCQLWRAIMLSFSVMWMDLPTVFLLEDYTIEKPYLDLLTELLKRSHNMPLRISILGDDEEGGYDEHTTHPAIDMLVLHSDRWQEIRIDGELGLLSALKPIKGRLSSLQSLHLFFCQHTQDPVNVHDLFQIAPALRYVDYTGPLYELLFPTHQLVRYSQDEAYLEQAIQVMVSSPALRNLRFRNSVGKANTLPVMAPTRLPDLIVLDASFESFELYPIYGQFFDNITTPALEELLVTTGSRNTIAPLCSMILRSGCVMKVLYLQISFAPGDLQSLLSLTPFVTKLSIEIPSAQDISALMFDGNTPPLVPRLKECEFLSKDGHDDFSPSTEIIQALKLLASSRCELPDNTISAETLLSFRVWFNLAPAKFRQDFDGWIDSEIAKELFKLHECLLDMLPELLGEDIPDRELDLEWKSNVTGLLTYLETLKIDKASDICISGIQYILYAISTGFDKGDVRFSFSLIAERILRKWESMLRDDIHDFRWLSTVSSLKYLSTTQNHALCSSPDVMKFFFYGVDINDILDSYVELYSMIARDMGVCHPSMIMDL